MALSARELAAIQADWQANVFDQTITINRPTNASGVFAQNTETDTLVAAGVPCYIQEPVETPIATIVDIPRARYIWTIQVAPGTDVRVNDLITLTSGRVLRVQNVDTGRSYPFTLEFDAAEAQ